MRLVLLVVTMFASIPDFIKVRNFSLITEKGENVLQPGFDRRRLRDSIASQRLTLKFNALERNFVFHLQKSHPIFAPDATIKLSGRVRFRIRTPILLQRVVFAYVSPHAQANGYVEVSPPEILSFSSAKHDAAITFVNSTTVNGVVFHGNDTFDIVASADYLSVN